MRPGETPPVDPAAHERDHQADRSEGEQHPSRGLSEHRQEEAGEEEDGDQQNHHDHGKKMCKWRSVRSERGWTQQQLAEAVGVSRPSIISIERERYVPSLLLALTFARVFERPTDDIFIVENEA